jgi:hypothetical protein
MDAGWEVLILQLDLLEAVAEFAKIGLSARRHQSWLENRRPITVGLVHQPGLHEAPPGAKPMTVARFRGLPCASGGDGRARQGQRSHRGLGHHRQGKAAGKHAHLADARSALPPHSGCADATTGAFRPVHPPGSAGARQGAQIAWRSCAERPAPWSGSSRGWVGFARRRTG